MTRAHRTRAELIRTFQKNHKRERDGNRASTNNKTRAKRGLDSRISGTMEGGGNVGVADLDERNISGGDSYITSFP